MSGLAIITFRNSVPGAQSVAESIAHNPAIQALNQTVWAFSLVEISHLVFLVLLGGATLVLALRVLGVTLGDVPLADVERLTRPWLRAGIVGGTLSGIFMSIATALTLVANGAFFIKILALVAAVLFSLALAARLRGGCGLWPKVAAAAGVAMLGASLWLFGSTRALDTGAMLIGAVAALFVLLVEVARRRGIDNDAGGADWLTCYLAYGTVAGWLTVTLAGRWIGFS